jgi:hypothetical protein
MKQIILCVTIATAIASSALVAHSETVPKTLQQNSIQKSGGSSLSIPVEPCVFIPTDPCQPKSQVKTGSSLSIPVDPIRPESANGISNKVVNSGNIRMLNPQPLPPLQ